MTTAAQRSAFKRRQEHIQNDVIRLRTAAEAAPLVVGYDHEKAQYWCAWTDEPDMRPLCAGRYQIVATYIDGFVRGYINRPVSQTSAEAKRKAADELAILAVDTIDGLNAYYLDAVRVAIEVLRNG